MFQKCLISLILENLFTFSAVCLIFFKKKLLPLKHILAFTTQGLKCTISVLQPFTFDIFQSEHPVWNLCKKQYQRYDCILRILLITSIFIEGVARLLVYIKKQVTTVYFLKMNESQKIIILNTIRVYLCTISILKKCMLYIQNFILTHQQY